MKPAARFHAPRSFGFPSSIHFFANVSPSRSASSSVAKPRLTSNSLNSFRPSGGPIYDNVSRPTTAVGKLAGRALDMSVLCNPRPCQPVTDAGALSWLASVSPHAAFSHRLNIGVKGSFH